MPLFDTTDYGAVGDGETKDTRAIQKTIDVCAEAGGGRVVIGGGKTFHTGAIALRSHVELHLETGATLRASIDPADYPMLVIAEAEKFPNEVLIQAKDAQNIAITGLGTIDGRARDEIIEDLGPIYRCHPQRQLVRFIGCRNVTLRDTTYRDSPFWAIHPIGCDDVLVHGIRILNDLKQPNCDGIDPDHCRNVRISDCHIESGDDCICPKSSRPWSHYGPCENITVTGCTLVSTSCAIKIGTEGATDFRNMVFDSCVIRRSNRGLGIQLRDEGNVENILFSNMTIETRLFADNWWGKSEPIYVSAFHRTEGSRLGRVRNVRFSNILCRGEAGVYASGSADSPLEYLTFDNVQVEMNKHTKHRGGLHDRRPCAMKGIVEHRTAGFFIEHAHHVRLRDCQVLWGDNRPDYYGHALEARRVEALTTPDFSGDAAHPDRDEAVCLDD